MLLTRGMIGAAVTIGYSCQAIGECLGTTSGTARNRVQHNVWLPHPWLEQIVGAATMHQWLSDDRFPTSRLEVIGQVASPAIDVVLALANHP
jgi:hypothetical protein